ncbi:hypothetical protein MMC20_003520 [Loxospora ochrophaea]|nr:hypothetical protein [Loxospora ochrophaea]
MLFLRGLLGSLIFTCCLVVTLSNIVQAHPHGTSTLATSISVRPPPTFSLAPNPYWPAPPSTYRYGTWYVTYSSQTAYSYYADFQTDFGPLTNHSLADQDYDLGSYYFIGQENPTKLYYSSGIDTPRYTASQRHAKPYAYEAVYNFHGNYSLNDIYFCYEMLAWGDDTAGNAYFLAYETPRFETSADITIFSKSQAGPTNETLTELLDAVRKLDIAELNEYVPHVVALAQDSRRVGQAPAIDSCVGECENLDDPEP